MPVHAHTHANSVSQVEKKTLVKESVRDQMMLQFGTYVNFSPQFKALL